ncbi:hypothetical protein ABZY68_15930 [Streptomyces sp. NPDC006482]|uniref:hypothetical protein n=1 Tax=Streptomyces sp. NPDC006482 TaxID=3154306 RepID=UPI0033B4BD50
MASCAGPEEPVRASLPTAERGSVTGTPPRPEPSAVESSSAENAVAQATNQMLAAATGANSPAPPGLLVAAEGDGGALFVWETADDRFCHGAASTAGATTVACTSRPDTPPVGEKPRITRLVAMVATGWNVVFGAEHETVESVTCNGVPVPVRDVGVLADGRRTIHAIEFPDITVGSVAVKVRRGKRVVTESLELLSPAMAVGQDLASCELAKP